MNTIYFGGGRVSESNHIWSSFTQPTASQESPSIREPRQQRRNQQKNLVYLSHSIRVVSQSQSDLSCRHRVATVASQLNLNNTKKLSRDNRQW